tara:strand:+ start:556 stop:708 length:153 start_codon:yes stop_codon:yes gene_type:complete
MKNKDRWKKLFLNYFDLNNDGKISWWEYLIPITFILIIEVLAELIVKYIL